MVLSEILSDVDKDEEDQSSDSEEANGESEEEENTILSDGDGDSEDESEEEVEDDEPQLGEPESEDESVGNTGWADAMAKVLAMGKNSTKPVSVLSKAKKGNAKKRKAEDGDSSSDDEPESKRKLEPLAVRKARKKEVDSIGRRMPNVLERNAEKALARIATRGVVQLFNAVRDHQKDVKFKLKEAGGSFRKQEKVYKNLNKESFIQMLSGKSVSKPGAGETQRRELGTEESQSSWSILREDYMLGAKMKDWDKESDEET